MEMQDARTAALHTRERYQATDASGDEANVLDGRTETFCGFPFRVFGLMRCQQDAMRSDEACMKMRDALCAGMGKEITACDRVLSFWLPWEMGGMLCRPQRGILCVIMADPRDRFLCATTGSYEM